MFTEFWNDVKNTSGTNIAVSLATGFVLLLIMLAFFMLVLGSTLQETVDLAYGLFTSVFIGIVFLTWLNNRKMTNVRQEILGAAGVLVAYMLIEAFFILGLVLIGNYFVDLLDIVWLTMLLTSVFTLVATIFVMLVAIIVWLLFVELTNVGHSVSESIKTWREDRPHENQYKAFK